MPKKRKYPWDAERSCFRVQVKGADGKYHAIRAETEAEMDAKVSDAKQARELALSISKDPTVAQYAVKWYGLVAPDLSPSRCADHMTSINKYICPRIGNMRLREVRLDDGKAILSRMAGMSKSSQSNVVAVLHQMFDAAEENGLIVRTPFRKLRPGGYDSEEKTPLTDEQADRLIDAVRDTRAYLFVMLGLYAGLRREEILGLRWCNVHLFGAGPHIAVRERVTFTPKTGAAVHERELKSKSSRRDIPIPSPLLTALLQTDQSKSEFVVPDKSGHAMSKGSFRRLWDMVEDRTIRAEADPDTGVETMQTLGSTPRNHPGCVRTLDFEVTPHLLRHTYITNLCYGGVNIKTIQYLAGHATAAITLKIYTHALANRPGQIIGDINSAFCKAQNKAQPIIKFPQTVDNTSVTR